MTLDPEESARRRDESMRQVDDAAREEWKLLADAAIEQCAVYHDVFTSDQVWVILDEQDTPRPREPRALGPRMKAATRLGIIEPTGGFLMSKRPETHRNPKRVYRSLVREP